MGTGVTHTSFFHTPTPYRGPKQVGQQKVIDNLQKQWEERFPGQEKKFQVMMVEMQAKHQNATSGSSNASQPTPSHCTPPPPIHPQPNVVYQQV